MMPSNITHRLLLLGCLALFACDNTLPDRDLPIWADNAGDAIQGLDSETQALYDQGRQVILQAFRTDNGLGPMFNTDSCASCHQFPVEGGSSPRYRDFWLMRAEREDGALVNVGTNGESPVRNIYALHDGHIAEPDDVAVYARRNAPSGLGVGLFSFVTDDEILSREDAADSNGDGISGRANYEQGDVGRFGYKSQASTLESFNRGALINQMGITSDPLFYDFPENLARSIRGGSPSLLDKFIATAFAQVSAPDEPTLDDDDAPDPEISNEDQLALLIYSTYLAPLRPSEPSETVEQGAKLFKMAKCTDCHVPELQSNVGPLPAYSDLLLHDMGPDFEDDLVVSLAEPSEFRTAPLWGVALHGPFLHDGRAETLMEAITMHGGEAQDAVDRFEAMEATDQEAMEAFLVSLGGFDSDHQILTHIESEIPMLGEMGGPDQVLTEEELEQWMKGRDLFDQSNIPELGLGIFFNADSCRACHRDPVLGGAGGIDVNVVRFGQWLENGDFEDLDRAAVPRVAIPGHTPFRMPDEANVVEWRNPPTILGVGLLDRVSEEAILELEDPEDLDGDGVSGRARILDDGSVGRFGWKAQIATAFDFTADALINEVGLTVDPTLTDFSLADDMDLCADPEMVTADFNALAFFVSHLAPPISTAPLSPEEKSDGEALFAATGCATCHVPELDGVNAFTDLLLHEIAPFEAPLVDQEAGLDPGEFRTPPLWGLESSGPYLHDGSAPTLRAAILDGHAFEGANARDAFEALNDGDQTLLIDYLNSI